jgi:hypothetical protein
MAATLEIKYFNTFLLKKIKTVVDADPQPVAPYADVPSDYAANTVSDWYIEESRIRGGYNNTSVDFGVKAYLDESDPLQQHRFNTLIYSGIFNSRTGINNTNQFSVASDITRSLDPSQGSIQKLYAEDTNLIVFQEDKVSRALIDKDAIYSAEGNAVITSTPLVIGQIVAYAGKYGISTDPFSFAVYGYRKYFTDRKRNCICRLSRDGITEISSYGMHDFFRDELSNLNNAKIVGGFDVHNKNYTVSIQQPYNSEFPFMPSQKLVGSTSNSPQWHIADRALPSVSNYKTAAFDESVLGWTSFYSYSPTFYTTLNSSFYTAFNGSLWLHHTLGSQSKYSNFYGTTYDSTVTLLLNSNPSVVKNFKTLNYEGSDGWASDTITTSSGDAALPIAKYVAMNNYSALENNMFANNFKRKENKFFANLLQDIGGQSSVDAGTDIVIAQAGEVLWGFEVSGLKGFFSTVKIKTINSVESGKKELFAVSSTIVESSY